MLPECLGPQPSPFEQCCSRVEFEFGGRLELHFNREDVAQKTQHLCIGHTGTELAAEGFRIIELT